MLESLMFPSEVQNFLKTLDEYEDHLHKENEALKNHRIQEFKHFLFRKEEMNLRYAKYLNLFKQPEIVAKINRQILTHIHERISSLKQVLMDNINFCQKAENQQISSLHMMKTIKQQKSQGAYYTKKGHKHIAHCSSVFGEL